MKHKAAKKQRYMEAQNHRCCYCGYVVSGDYNPNHPRYPSWEHVIAQVCGGKTCPENLVISCVYCNQKRDMLGLSAYDFYEWAQSNLNDINNDVDRIISRSKRKNIPLGQRRVNRRVNRISKAEKRLLTSPRLQYKKKNASSSSPEGWPDPSAEMAR
jgi:hypothetical protein